MESAKLYANCVSQDLSTKEEAYQELWQYLYRIAFYIVYDQPDAPGLAQDCAQKALIRIHDRITECHTPAAFKGWAKTIVKNAAVDSLRRRKRLIPLEDDRQDESGAKWSQGGPSLEEEVVDQMRWSEIRDLITQAPISDRSRRTIIGRYFDELPDESLANAESDIAGKKVLPSHLQVTRAKNLSKLRKWPLLKQAR